MDGFIIGTYKENRKPEDISIIYQFTNFELTKVCEVSGGHSFYSPDLRIIAINNNTLYYENPDNKALISVDLETKQKTVLGTMLRKYKYDLSIKNKFTRYLDIVKENTYGIIDVEIHKQIWFPDAHISEENEIELEGYKIDYPISLTNNEFIFKSNNTICYYNLIEQKITKTMDISIHSDIATYFLYVVNDGEYPFFTAVPWNNYFCKTIYGESYIFSLTEGKLINHFIADWIIPFEEAVSHREYNSFVFFESGENFFMVPRYRMFFTDK